MTEQKTFIKSVETESGVFVRFRVGDKTFVEEVLFENYLFVKKEDFSLIQRSIKKFSDRATIYKAKNGDFVKIYLKNNFERYFLKTTIERFGVKVYEGDISASQRHIVDCCDNYDFKNLKVLWFDLETMDLGEFTKDEMGNVIAGEKQILSCAMIDENGKEFYVINKNPDNKTGDEEKELIKEMLNIFKDYDVISAWNGNFFDFRYLEQRMDVHIKNGEDFDKIFNLKLINKLDELIVYKKYTWNKHDSYSLNSIANDELSDGKIDFSDKVSSGRGKFYQLFKENPIQFKEYNLKDVQLMKKLNEKIKYYDIHKTTCQVTKCNAEECLYTSKMFDNNLLRLNHEKNYICDSKPSNAELLTRDYINISGGYTFAKPGLYWDVKLFDFKSHYPLCIRTFNIGQETFVTSMQPDLLEIKDKFDEKEWLFLVGVFEKFEQKAIEKYLKEHNLSGEQIMFKFIELYEGKKIKEYAEKNNLTFTPADLNKDTCGWQFHPHRLYIKDMSALAKYVSDSMNERDKQKYYIKEMTEKDPSFEKTMEFEVLNLKDIALKIIANGAYGSCGLKSSRFFDYHVADAITTSARWIIKKAILFSKKQGLEVIQNDTDSAYIIMNNFKGSVDDLNLLFYNYFKDELFINFSKHQKFKFKNLNTKELEDHDFFCIFEYKKKQIDGMISVAKKRYYFLSNGDIKSVGGAMRKNDTNPLAKILQKQLCKDIMTKSYSHENWLKILNEWKEKCFSNKLEEKYLIFQKQYSKHWSKFGQAILDENGMQKVSKNGKLREAPVPCHIKLARRLEETGKTVEVGDMLKYIVEKPKICGLVCASRKKVDRQKFKECEELSKKTNLSLDEFKKLLENNGVEFKECFESKQTGITIEEFKSGELYDAETYWRRIITPICEIMNVVYPRETIEIFGKVWNMSEKEILKELNLLNIEE